jgi:putative ABC transport system substrate-binding protein
MGGRPAALNLIEQTNREASMRRASFIEATFALAVVALTGAPAAEGQQTTRIARIGFLQGGNPPEAASDWKQRSPFYQGLADLGWQEGTNLSVEWRWADGQLDRLPALAAELVQLKPDVIVAGAFRPGQAAAHATSTIPVVLVTCDPYQYIVDGLARPGGNVTGQTCLSSEMSPKKLEFLKRAAPTISRVAFLYNPDDPGPTLALKLCQAAAPSLGVTLVPFTIQRPSEISDVLTRVGEAQVDALFVYPDSVTGRVRARTAEFASQQRLPTVYGFRSWVDDGGLMSYGASLPAMTRRAAGQVDKILKGAKPADIPVEQPTTFELVINLKAATAIGLTVPPALLDLADVVIE